MLLLVGLGNPGSQYAGNRHNIGFMALDAIAKRNGIRPWRRRFQGLSAEGLLGGERALLLLPGTYMNDSGRAVAEAAHFFKLSLSDIVVFHDEIDLAPGKVRVKTGGIIADNTELLAKGQDAAFQNKVHLGMQAKGFLAANEPEQPDE